MPGTAVQPDDDRVMTLVELALNRPMDERQAYLRSACSGDDALFGEVWRYVQWEQRMDGFLLEPLYSLPPPDQPFETGELLDGRFRIVRAVAEGGMGVVYEGRDEKLDRRIAIKCAKAGFSKRLPPEVRNASEISHPNVCKIFEIHTAETARGEVEFFTMEFLEGETLGERLRRGPVPEPEARAIAQQLCAGLAEAHRNRVVHGDLKSNNVILSKAADGALRAVITDFGLARGLEHGHGAVEPGETGGTPAYMAPEMWRGGTASLASDVYALGVLLYELAAGRLPYGPNTPWEERLSGKPPAVRSKWDRVISRCLDPDPERRFQSADDVARALAPPSRRWFVATAAAAVLAAATGLITYQRATAPEETVRLAVLPFEANADAAPLARELFEATSARVAGLKGDARTAVSVVASNDVLRNRAETIEDVQRLLGATHVLRGMLEREGPRVIVRAALVDAGSGVNAKEWTAEYAAGEEKYIPTALAGVVTATLGLPPLESNASVNAAARQDYLDGLASLRRDTGVDAALASLERAVAADPDSALTHAALAEARWFKYFLTKDQQWLDRSTDSLREAQRRNLDLAPVHRIAGLLDANAGWYAQAVIEYQRAIELEPENGDAYRRLGQAYEANNQPDEALLAYQRAVDAQGNYITPYQDLGAFHMKRARYGEAATQFQKAVELEPSEPAVRFALALAYMGSGKFSDAESQLRLAIGLKEDPRALHALGAALMYQERDSEAAPYLKRALEVSPRNYLSWWALGICYRRMGRSGESEQASRRGMEIVQAEIARNPRDGYVRSYLAYLSAVLRDRTRARSEIEQALRLSPDDSDVRWMAVLTYEALDDREASLAVLGSASRESLEELSRWPDVADLARDARFQQLMASRAP